MFCREGYLTFFQLRCHIIQKFGDVLDGFKEPDGDSLITMEQIQSAWVEWQMRIVFDSTQTIYLIAPNLEPVGVDAPFLLFAQPDAPVFEHDIGLESPLTVIALQKFCDDLLKSWVFINSDLGILRIPVSKGKWWDRFFLRENVPEFFALVSEKLRPYEGRSVCLLIEDVDSALDWCRAQLEVIGESQSEVGLADTGLRHALKCFQDAFPQGKGDLPWHEVEKVSGYSRRTINRALAKLNGQKSGQGMGKLR